jgi:hypothetical protein
VNRAGSIVVGVAGAALVGLLAGCGGGGGSSASVDTTPLKAPERISAYSRLTDVPIMRSAAGKRVAEHRLLLDRKTAQQVSKAYGGAGALAVEYADPSLDLVPLLVAVRAQSPRPWFPTEDVALEKLVKPRNEVVHIGGVDCVIKNAPTTAGHKPKPGSAQIQSCMRTGPKLTVYLENVQNFAQAEQVAPLVDSAFDQLSKS